MRNYRRGLIAALVALAMVLVSGIVFATRSDAATVTYKVNRDGDWFAGSILKGSIRKKTFKAYAYVKWTSRRVNGRHTYSRVKEISAITNFEGTRMGCSSGSYFAGTANHYQTRVTFYFKDNRGRNFRLKKTMPCQSDTYVARHWAVGKNNPVLYGGARMRAHFTIDVRPYSADAEGDCYVGLGATA